MIQQNSSIAKQILVFGMMAVLFLMTFSFHSDAAEKRATKESTQVSVAVMSASTGCLQAETHSEVILKLSHVIFDLAATAIQDGVHKKSEIIFLAVNSFVRNPFYAVPTVHAP